MSMRLAEVMGLGPDEIDLIHRGCLLHDVGKIGVPARILDKLGKLTVKEFWIVQQHLIIRRTHPRTHHILQRRSTQLCGTITSVSMERGIPKVSPGSHSILTPVSRQLPMFSTP